MLKTKKPHGCQRTKEMLVCKESKGMLLVVIRCQEHKPQYGCLNSLVLQMQTNPFPSFVVRQVPPFLHGYDRQGFVVSVKQTQKQFG